MILNFNGEFIEEKSLKLDIGTNRCFLYGDGVFESMLGTVSEIRFWQDHYERLLKSAAAIQLDIQRLPGYENLHLLMTQLIKKNSITEPARVKLQLWRTSGGLYTPATDDISYIITVSELVNPLVIVKEHVKIIASPRLHFSPYSSAKTCNSLPYVLASKERKRQGLDDVVLLDQKGRLAELSAMNLFWVQKDKLFTPSLNTGCISGIMRKKVLEYCQENKIKTSPALANPEVLADCEYVFGTNYCGIHPISRINDWKFQPQLPGFISTFIDKKLRQK